MAPTLSYIIVGLMHTTLDNVTSVSFQGNNQEMSIHVVISYRIEYIIFDRWDTEKLPSNDGLCAIHLFMLVVHQCILQ